MPSTAVSVTWLAWRDQLGPTGWPVCATRPAWPDQRGPELLHRFFEKASAIGTIRVMMHLLLSIRAHPSRHRGNLTKMLYQSLQDCGS